MERAEKYNILTLTNWMLCSFVILFTLLLVSQKMSIIGRGFCLSIAEFLLLPEKSYGAFRLVSYV